MIFHRVRGQVQFCANHVSACPVQHQLGYLGLPRCQSERAENQRRSAAWVGRLRNDCYVVIDRAMQISRVNE